MRASRKVILLAALLVFGLEASAFSTKLKGYEESPSEVFDWKMSVRRWDLGPTAFFVLFDHNETFFSFPLRKEQREEVANFLRKAGQDHRALSVRINPWNAHILSIETPH